MSVILLLGSLKNADANEENIQEEVFRIHIRANSNADFDQSVKYEVKSVLTEFITPLLINATTKEHAIAIIRSRLSDITNIAKVTLEKYGFYYGATAKITKEEFPTRDYNGNVFPAGEYDALLVELGEAKGDNWWCVVYPPLCFVNGYDISGDMIICQSKLKEIISDFFSAFMI